MEELVSQIYFDSVAKKTGIFQQKLRICRCEGSGDCINEKGNFPQDWAYEMLVSDKNSKSDPVLSCLRKFWPW